MELNNFIKINNLNNFELLKEKLEAVPYNLKFKEDNDYPDFFLIHNQESSDFNLKIVNECNGIILNKKDLKIICYTFDKCNNSTIIPNIFDFDNLHLEYSVEGTLIRLFFKNKWCLSTKKCIDANKSKWLSDKSFQDLFKEIFDEKKLDSLDQNYCYSFILTHPENNIIVNYETPNLILISTRDMNNLNEINYDIEEISKLEKKKIDKVNIESICNDIINQQNLLNEGFIFIDTNFNRWKLKSNLYNKVRNLWGNTNNRFFRYIELRKNPEILNDYLYYFKNDTELFKNYEEKLNFFYEYILKNYINKHVTKNIIKLPFYLKDIVYKLHGDYLKNKTITDINKVIFFLYNYDTKKICFMFNSYVKDIESTNLENIENYMDEN